MLEFLKELDGSNHDAIFFVPGEEENEIHIETKSLLDPGEKLGGSEIGDSYHIILFKTDEENGPKDLDRWEAILLNPLEYISTLIPQNWFGMVCRKTTTSGKFADDLFDKLKSM